MRPRADVIGRPIWAPGRLPASRRNHRKTRQVSTRRIIYDALGRTLSVDYDLEHPVDCSSAPDGILIGDEEYLYDACRELILCRAALGAKSTDARRRVIDLVRAWLQPSAVGSANRFLEADELALLLARFAPDEELEDPRRSIRRARRAAASPQVAARRVYLVARELVAALLTIGG